MGAKQSVELPVHLWTALDDMSRDGAQAPDALMEMAVETFVALQGYDVPVAERAVAPSPITTEKPAPKPTAKAQSLQDDDDVGLAQTMARSALVPEMKRAEQAEPPVVTDMAPAYNVGAGPPSLSGIAPTHVPIARRAPPAATPPAPAPAPAPAPPVSAPPSGKTKPPQEAARAPVEPAWLKRPALADSDEERAAARERLVAIDADVEKLTIERPTTQPLSADVTGRDDSES